MGLPPSLPDKPGPSLSTETWGPLAQQRTGWRQASGDKMVSSSSGEEVAECCRARVCRVACPVQRSGQGAFRSEQLPLALKGAGLASSVWGREGGSEGEGGSRGQNWVCLVDVERQVWGFLKKSQGWAWVLLCYLRKVTLPLWVLDFAFGKPGMLRHALHFRLHFPVQAARLPPSRAKWAGWQSQVGRVAELSGWGWGRCGHCCPLLSVHWANSSWARG